MKQIGINWDKKSIEVGPDDTPESECYIVFKGKTYKGKRATEEAEAIMREAGVAFAKYED